MSGRWASEVEAFTASDLAFAVAPLLDPEGLRAIAGVCPAWKQRAASQAAHGGVAAWLGSSFAEDLEADSMYLCRRAADSCWFDQRHWDLAFIAAACGDQEPLDRALELLSQLPMFVPLPPPWLRSRCPEDFDEGAAVDGDSWSLRRGEEASLPQGSRYPQPRKCGGDMTATALGVARALHRSLSAAYISADSDWDTKAQSLCNSVVGRWLGLWSCAHCGSREGAKSRTNVDEILVRHQSLRGTEWWKVRLVLLGPSDSAETGSIAAVTATYWERRLLG